MESVDNSQFNPPNYFSREDQRPREHQRGYSKVCLRRVCFRCEPLSREISRIFFFSSHWEFHEYRHVSPIFHPLWWFHAEFCVDGKEDTYTEERLSSKTIIVASIINDIFAFDLVLRTYRWISFNNRIESNEIWRIKKLVKGSKLLLELQKIETKILSNLCISANWNNLRSIVS